MLAVGSFLVSKLKKFDSRSSNPLL